jgi:O-succinylbenzoic acid--CoA ligase
MEIVINTGPHGSFEESFLESFSQKRSCLLLDPRLAPEVRHELHDAVSRIHVRPETVWIASSGTTQKKNSLPRLVALSWVSLEASAASVNAHLLATSQDVWLQVLPDFHVGGLGIRVRAILSESRVVSSVGNLAPWSARQMFEDLVRHRATLTSLVPAQLFDLVQAGFLAPSHLRAVVIGGQALAPLLYERARALGWPVLPSYGMTETSSQVATAALSSLSEGTFPSLQVLAHAQIIKSNDGLLAVRASSLLDGILSKESEKWSFVDPKENQVFLTSDRGEVMGSLVQVAGRASDQVKIGGELVDRVLLEHLLLEVRLSLNIFSDCALLFEPDVRLGFVVGLLATDAADGDRVVAEFNRQALPAARIRSLRVVQTIARDALGKRALR